MDSLASDLTKIIGVGSIMLGTVSLSAGIYFAYKDRESYKIVFNYVVSGMKDFFKKIE